MELDNIIKGCKKGRADAQRQLYETYKKVLFAVSLRYCANFSDAEDNLHNAFVEILTQIGKFRNRGSFEGWMKRITINKAIDSYKRTFHLVPIIDALIETEDVSEEEMDVPLDRILSLVQSLPPQCRMVFTLYELDDYSHQQIAEMLSISEGSSKSNLHRAKALLKKKLSAESHAQPSTASHGK